jgi:hypothetical protein
MKIFSVRDDLNNIELGNPGRLHGGVYFAKISVDQHPLYFKIENQFTPGIANGEYKYLDIILNNETTVYQEWFHSLEETIKNIIRVNKTKWFSTNIDSSDIDYFYNSCLFLNDNNIIVRSKIIHKNNQATCKVFDENKIMTNLESIHNQKVSSIIHIRGVLLTNTKFHLEIENKQVVYIEDYKLFDECLLDNKEPEKEQIKKMYVIEEPESTSIKYLENNTINDENECKNQGKLQEYSINFSSIPQDETIKIKKTKDIYRNEYNDAKLKAKLSKAEAIRDYIEIEKLKEKYAITSSDSESEYYSDDDTPNQLLHR